MNKPLLVLKSSLLNALLPMLIKILSFSLIPVIILFGVAMLLKAFNVINYSTKYIIVILIILLFAISLIPMIIRSIILKNTSYYFFTNHVLSEFKFIKIHRVSVPYNQIANMTTSMSLWDRMCKTGNIIIHTSDESAPNLVLYYMRKPAKIEDKIYDTMNRIKNTLARKV